MHIVIFGATGLVGSATVKEALGKGHIVTILVRTPSKLNIRHPNLKVIKGDALDANAVIDALKGAEAVIQTLGYGGKGDGKPTTFTADATRLILDGMKKHKVNRIIAMSVAGAGNSISFFPKILTKFVFPTFMKWFVYIINDKNKMESEIMNSELDWTIVRSITIKNKPASGKINPTLDGKNMKYSINVGDVAHFLVQQLTDNSFSKQAPVISQ
ncbi:NAD(P)H-binding protein [Chishuiella sp.]|uniref:NAD(P)-dependent oxidoreductase n=1 Tax=Chishuiella sp. TaxID=1969467 RepID=UPI0028AFBC87|nr:NAD(P)H-binding protein [Chishuiella sp.]